MSLYSLRNFNQSIEDHKALQKLLEKKNIEMQESISQLKKSLEESSSGEGKRLHLDHLFMKRILCFSECVFNFNSLENTVALLYGPNGYGKSSFLEGICIALFGDGIPSRHISSMSASVLNSTMDTEGVGHTIIKFTLGTTHYELSRKLSRLKTHRLRHNECVLKALNDPNFKGYSGPNAVDKWVKENIGTIKNFLLTCLVSQSADEDFLSLQPKDQIEMINQSLKLDSVNSLTDFLHTAINSYKLVKSHLDIIIKDSSIKDEENSSKNSDCNETHYQYFELKSSIEVIDSEIELKSFKKIDSDAKWNHLNVRGLSISFEDISQKIDSLNLSWIICYLWLIFLK